MAIAREYAVVRHKYSAIEKINLFISIYGRLLAAIFRPSWWLPFLLYGFVQALGLAGLVWYYAPVWINIIYPILSSFFPEPVFHYPQYYLALPSIYSAYDSFVLGPTIWIICLGAAIHVLGGAYSGQQRPLGDGIRLSLRSYPQMIIAWLIEMLLIILILYLPAHFLQRYLVGSPNRILVISLFLQFVAFGVSGMLLYTIPGIILDGRKVGPAIKDSLGLFFGNMFLSYFIVFLPSVIRLILSTLLGNFSARIVELLNPGLIPTLIFVQIIVGIFINLFIYGAAVFVYKEMRSEG